MNKILLIEDSSDFQMLISKTLSSPTNHLIVASNSKEALEWVKKETFDLILLDVGLPDQDGFSLCQELQSLPKTANTAIIFITGKNHPADVIAGFSLGADDFITKPFEPLVMRARIEARLRKVKLVQQKEEVLEIEDLQAHIPHMKVYQVDGTQKRDLQLTPTEFKLFVQFVRAPERVFSREQLLNLVWGDAVIVSDRTVDVHISTLRKKLGHYGKSIQAVPNSGYRFQPSFLHKIAA